MVERLAERIYRNTDFKGLGRTDSEDMRIASKLHVLALSATEKVVKKKHYRGEFDSLDVSPEDYRQKLGLYGISAMNETVNDLCDRGYLKRIKRSNYKITEKGLRAYTAYLAAVQTDTLALYSRLKHSDSRDRILRRIASEQGEKIDERFLKLLTRKMEWFNALKEGKGRIEGLNDDLEWVERAFDEDVVSNAIPSLKQFKDDEARESTKEEREIDERILKRRRFLDKALNNGLGDFLEEEEKEDIRAIRSFASNYMSMKDKNWEILERKEETNDWRELNNQEDPYGSAIKKKDMIKAIETLKDTNLEDIRFDEDEEKHEKAVKEIQDLFDSS